MMIALRPGTVLFWEVARLPFNALLAMFSVVAFEPLFARFPTDAAWSYVWTRDFVVTFALANIFYSLSHPLDRLLQRSNFQGRASAGRVALWGGLTLLSIACVSRVASSLVSMAFF